MELAECVRVFESDCGSSIGWLEAARCIRDQCAAPNTLLQHNATAIIHTAVTNIHAILIHKQTADEQELVCARICIQILGNMVCGLPESVNMIWVCTDISDYWALLLAHPDEKLREYSAMLLYNCLRLMNTSSYSPHQISSLATWKSFQAVCDICLVYAHECGWHSFIVELMLTCTDLPLLHMTAQQQISVLDVMRDSVNRSLANPCSSQPRLADCNLLHVLSLLRAAALTHAHWIHTAHNAPVVLAALHFVADAAQDDQYRAWICEQRSVTVDLLLLAARTLQYYITEYNTVTASASQNEDNEPEHDQLIRDMYSWQKLCVRIVGNLCYHCVVCQQSAGAAACVESLHLGCVLCALDLRRPFLREWAQVALANLVQNCAINQTRLHECGLNNQTAFTVTMSDHTVTMSDHTVTMSDHTVTVPDQTQAKVLTEHLLNQMSGMQL